MGIAHLTDMVTTAAGRVLTQYLPKPKVTALVQQLAQRAQDAEDALWGVVAMLSYSTATGVWLDWIGAIVGQQRHGKSDSYYRQLIAARIVANGSNGTIEQLLSVLALVVGFGPAAGVIVTESANATITFRIPASVSFIPQGQTTLVPLMELLRAARSAGVKAELLCQSDDDPLQFVMGDAAGDPTTGLGFSTVASPTGGMFTGAYY